jgi:amidase
MLSTRLPSGQRLRYGMASVGEGDRMQDRQGAFCRHSNVRVSGAAAGPLAGLTMAVKDIYDVGGETCCCGNPDWLRSHGPAGATAPAVQALLDAAATLVGKTLTEELAYSLIGENVHYGTPVNSRCPERVPGGSSSGSVAAVAGGLVDFALGSDTGGSVRIPAALCGTFGIRPSHGRISLDCCMPLAPSFDTCGWFTCDASLLRRIGAVLLGSWPAQAPGRFLLGEDAFAIAEPAVRDALATAVGRLGAAERVGIYQGAEDDWVNAFRVLQAAEIWRAHGDWVRTARPTFGPGIRERFEMAAKVTADQVRAADVVRDRATARLAALLADNAVLVIPTAPDIAPLKRSPQAALEHFRDRTLRLTCIAGLARLPQVTLPVAEAGGCPVGLSLVAARGQDGMLLDLAEGLARALV